jgi:hypothetical protein
VGARVLGCLALACTALSAQGDPRSQSDRVAARIKALQAESDRLAAQARTVFGDLRTLELDRELRQQEVITIDLELARVTADRDRSEARVAELEAMRMAQTPGVKERLIELSKRGRGWTRIDERWPPSVTRSTTWTISATRSSNCRRTRRARARLSRRRCRRATD